ncbi:MAG: hypothetical protein ACM32F_06725 [Betaproteobacteria bacterium]
MDHEDDRPAPLAPVVLATTTLLAVLLAAAAPALAPQEPLQFSASVEQLRPDPALAMATVQQVTPEPRFDIDARA